MYVVLEPQYQSALSAAVNSLNANNPVMCIEVVGYLLEELRNAKNIEALKAGVYPRPLFSPT